MSRFRDESLDDAADRTYEERRQDMADAYHEGRKVGRMGLGAGLCPLGYCDDERNEWIKGSTAGAGELLAERRKAA